MNPRLELSLDDGRFYEVYNRDFLLADEIKPSSVDLVVTSPPYNIGKEYEKIMEFDEYLEFTKGWITKVSHFLKPTGVFWLNVGFFKAARGRQYIPWPYHIFHVIEEIGGLELVQEIVWHYGAGVNCMDRFSPRNEKWLFYVKDISKYTFNLDDVRVPHKYPHQYKNGKLKVNPKGKNPGDVWLIKKVTSGTDRSSPERTPHPAQFPEDVVRRIINVCSNPRDVILDPFLGSGTTMKVSRDLGRSCIGYEIESSYIDDIIKRRVFDEYSIQDSKI